MNTIKITDKLTHTNASPATTTRKKLEIGSPQNENRSKVSQIPTHPKPLWDWLINNPFKIYSIFYKIKINYRYYLSKKFILQLIWKIYKNIYNNNWHSRYTQIDNLNSPNKKYNNKKYSKLMKYTECKIKQQHFLVT